MPSLSVYAVLFLAALASSSLLPREVHNGVSVAGNIAREIDFGDVLEREIHIPLLNGKCSVVIASISSELTSHLHSSLGIFLIFAHTFAFTFAFTFACSLVIKHPQLFKTVINTFAYSVVHSLVIKQP
jgi:hypothetical protein